MLSLKCFICEVLLFLLRVKMTKCRRGRRCDKMTHSSHLLSLNIFYNATIFHVNEPILSILFSPPINIIVMTVWCPILIICHVYMILKVLIKKQVLRHHWQDPRWTACLWNDLLICICSSRIEINRTAAII